MQGVTIFFPIYENYRERQRHQRTLDIIQEWEESRKDDEANFMSKSTTLSTSERSKMSSSSSGSRSRRIDMYTMAALEKALSVNPTPLLQFAATKDFTAENIIFLMQVHRWRADWDHLVGKNPEPSTETKLHLFNAATGIYATSISNTTSEFPVNIDGRIRRSLDTIFGLAVQNTRPGFVDSSSEGSTTSLWDGQKKESLDNIDIGKIAQDPYVSIKQLGDSTGIIDSAFTRHVFDDAESSVKYLVLTNTWQRFVRTHDIVERPRSGI